MFETDVITEQPRASLLTTGSSNSDVEEEGERRNDEINIRNMVIGDSEFAARMTVEAFRGKMEWGAGKDRIEDLVGLMTRSYQCSPDIYPRYFIALCNDTRVGLLALRLKNDPEPAEADYLETYSMLGFCGFCGMLPVSMEIDYTVNDTKQCHIHHVTVLEKYRNQGIGTVLLDFAEEEAKRLGCSYTSMICYSLSPSLSMYESHGYMIGKTKGCCETGARWYKMVKQL
ncbi:uncharacterized protein LOC144453965 [Glandiceps talaboti]